MPASRRIHGAELEAAWTPPGLLLDSQSAISTPNIRNSTIRRFPRRQPRLPDPGLQPEMDDARGAQYSFDLGNVGQITLGGQARYRVATALAVDNTLSSIRQAPERRRRTWHHDRGSWPVPEGLLGRATPASSGKTRASIWRSASTATICSTRNIRPTPRNSPRSAASGRSITARRGRSRCASRPATERLARWPAFERTALGRHATA